MKEIPVYCEKNPFSAHRSLFSFTRCLLVTGKASAEACGALAAAKETLEEMGISCVHENGIRSNPTVASCMGAGFLGKDADFVLGIGGGSAMDAAKAAAVFAANPGLSEDAFYRKDWSCPPLPIFLAGTTAGTGSEVTDVAVLTDNTGRKHSIHDPRMYAQAAFCDPTWLSFMPAGVAESAGVDVLAHCLESAFSKKATEASIDQSIQGIQKALAPLRLLSEEKALTDEDWAALYQASIHGGRAIAVTGTCFPHNVGYYFTEKYTVPHGFACALLLPFFLRHVQAEAPNRVTSFFNGAGSSSDEILSLLEKLVPTPSFTLTAKEIDDALPRWEDNGSVKNTLGTIGTAEIKQILSHF